MKVVYAIDKPEGKQWQGEVGFISKEVIKKYLPGPSDKVQILVCGKLWLLSVRHAADERVGVSGPPGQVASVAGPKDGMKQGALAGALKELGYTEQQVRRNASNF